MVTIIIPTYNEATTICGALDCLDQAQGDFEVIVADGESSDGTAEMVRARAEQFSRPLRVLTAARPRAAQLNRAAREARGGVLLFLHADVRVPRNAIETLVRDMQATSSIGGNFDLAFDGESRWSRFFTWANRVRRRFGIYYGDSGIFIRRDVFEALGGFKEIPVMEDYEFVRRMERKGKTRFLTPQLIVSDRRWREGGVLRTIARWVLIQGLYSIGCPPRLLQHWYPPARTGGAGPATGTRDAEFRAEHQAVTRSKSPGR